MGSVHKMHLQKNLVAPINDYVDIKERKQSSKLKGRNDSLTKQSTKKKKGSTTDNLMKEVHALNEMFSAS